MQTCTGHTLALNQIQYIGRKEKENQMRAREIDICRSTVVDRLVASVTGDPSISWIILLAEKDSDLITIKMRRWLAGVAETVVFDDDLGDILDSPIDHAKSLRD